MVGGAIPGMVVLGSITKTASKYKERILPQKLLIIFSQHLCMKYVEIYSR